jgi:hypothetical protein
MIDRPATDTADAGVGKSAGWVFEPRPLASNTEFPSTLAEAESERIHERRRALGCTNIEPTCGVACSGGGIRSATFCLGVFQGLAQLGHLKSIDYLSTVSGGGYFGGFFGSLFVPRQPLPRTPSPDEVQNSVKQALTDAASPVVAHLRENGRYLAPSGTSDYVTAVAIYLRNWAAVHWVIGTMLLGFFLGLNWLRSSLWEHCATWKAFEHALAVAAGEGYIWLSPWVALPLIAFVGAVAPLATAFWFTQYGASREDASIWARIPLNQHSRLRRNWPLLAGAVILVTSAFTLANRVSGYADGIEFNAATVVPALALVVTLLAITYWALTESWARRRDPSADLLNLQSLSRNLLTNGLARAIRVFASLLLVGVIDSLGQTTYALVSHGVSAINIGLSALGLGALYVAANKLAPLLTKPEKMKSGWIRVPFQVVALVGGIISLLVVLLLWNVMGSAWAWRAQAPNEDPGYLIAKAIIKTKPSASIRSDGSLTVAPTTPDEWHYESPDRGMATDWLLDGFALLLVINLLTGQSLTLINLSSLQGFYGARLRRAYLGAANVERTGYVPGTVPIIPPAVDERKSMRVARKTDDIPWAKYHPEALGGPLHLINVTVDETLDATSDIETQDRKGFNFAVGPLGVTARRDHAMWKGDGVVAITKTADNSGLFEPSSPAAPLMIESCSTSRWIAISGAAFSTGLGARTSLGLSLLLGLANVRLGYWWNSARASQILRILGRVWHFLFRTQIYLCNECVARFHGPARSHWYLSDGGHFENTAAYELIRRRLPFIILLDNGQDAQYEFEDLANLVRKVRIDFGAETEFMEQSQLLAIGGNELAAILGSLPQLQPAAPTDPASTTPGIVQRHSLLARVRYPGIETVSWLLVLKPSLTGDEPLDVQQYAATHPLFPQEPTADQFFDEAQWESYRRLGEHVCHAVLENQFWKLKGLL